MPHDHFTVMINSAQFTTIENSPIVRIVSGNVMIFRIGPIRNKIHESKYKRADQGRPERIDGKPGT